jgi:hypothetical protein
MLISTALLLNSNTRNSVCTPAKLPSAGWWREIKIKIVNSLFPKFVSIAKFKILCVTPLKSTGPVATRTRSKSLRSVVSSATDHTREHVIITLLKRTEHRT